jgi:hypothetical protein
MKILTLIRYAYLPDATIGRIIHTSDGMLTKELWTIERQWNYNKRFVSCLPPELYELRPHNGTKYQNTYVLVSEKARVFATEAECRFPTDRFTCVFHPGSWAINFEGCIGAGFYRIGDNDRWGVGGTVDGISYLIQYIKTYDITHLMIRNNEYSRTEPTRQGTL